VVTAIFYTFNITLVRRHIPRAWTLADPEVLVAERLAGVGEALERTLGTDAVNSPEMAEAAELARVAAEACLVEGHPLSAAHRPTGWSDRPHQLLWQAMTVLREYRGDAHNAMLLRAGLTGLEALITHTATGQGFVFPFAMASRGWSHEQWSRGVDGLRDRGILDGMGGLTDRGAAQRDELEEDTYRSGARPWDELGEKRLTRLAELVDPMVRRIVEAGAFPDGVFASR
jgi:hypothetical protein